MSTYKCKPISFTALYTNSSNTKTFKKRPVCNNINENKHSQEQHKRPKIKKSVFSSCETKDL